MSDPKLLLELRAVQELQSQDPEQAETMGMQVAAAAAHVCGTDRAAFLARAARAFDALSARLERGRAA